MVFIPSHVRPPRRGQRDRIETTTLLALGFAARLGSRLACIEGIIGTVRPTYVPSSPTSDSDLLSWRQSMRTVYPPPTWSNDWSAVDRPGTSVPSSVRT